jgi:predicted DNA-binding antitoxin AbrB/MazE fold protein
VEKTFEAVYENGVLRPLEALAISERQHVLVTISDVPATAPDVAGYFEPDEWEAAKRDDISLEEVRQALASIQGSLADAAITSREER